MIIIIIIIRRPGVYVFFFYFCTGISLSYVFMSSYMRASAAHSFSTRHSIIQNYRRHYTSSLCNENFILYIFYVHVYACARARVCVCVFITSVPLLLRNSICNKHRGYNRGITLRAQTSYVTAVAIDPLPPCRACVVRVRRVEVTAYVR